MSNSTKEFQNHLSRGIIPGLDGTRAIAALAVVLYHWNSTVTKWSPGPYAVIFFFVLSGFLITTLLLREENRNGTVNLRAFWLRRALRILPAFYVALLIQAAVLKDFPDDFIAAAFYVSNYYQAHRSWVTTLIGPTWSLSVEEQFYFLWPMLFVFVTDKARLKKCLIAGIIGVELARALGNHFGITSSYMYFAFEFRCDALMIGCLMAFLLKERAQVPGWILSKSAGLLSLVFFIAIMGPTASSFAHAKFLAPFAYTIGAYASALLIIQAIAYAPAILENKIMRFLGSTSYSIYLYHYAALDLVRHMMPAAAQMQIFISYLAVTIGLATMSFFLIEKQFLKLKRFLTPQLQPAMASDLTEVRQAKVIPG